MPIFTLRSINFQMPKYRKIFSHRIVLSLSLAIFICPAIVADTISLNNGRKFTGEIKKETATHITLDIGGGSISFRKSSIKSIIKSDSSTSAQTHQRPINALKELNPPNELIDIANAYKKIKKERFSAIQAKKKGQGYQNKRADLIKRYAKEKQRRTAIAQQVNITDPNLDRRGYNQLVYQQNQSTNKLNTIQDQLTKSFQEVTSGKKIISHYLQALDTLKSKTQDSKSRLDKIENKDQAKSFWGKLEKKLARFDNEFKSLNVPHESANGHMILTVRINDNIEGRFLLDTGASYVTLSQEMAKRLNLNLSSPVSLPLTMADGSTVEGKPVILNSMRVGDVQADRVTAIVLPSPPSKGFDGLLGMSFLREFVINFDPANKKLVFKRFRP
jgi:clan AA aspartic protease (TIGR02281 family)